jgi:hypothetical protein
MHRLVCCIDDILVCTAWRERCIRAYHQYNTSSGAYEYIINTTIQTVHTSVSLIHHFKRCRRVYHQYNNSSGAYENIHRLKCCINDILECTTWNVVLMIYSHAPLEVLYWWYTRMHRLKRCINDILVYTAWSVVLMIYYNALRGAYEYIINTTLQELYTSI